MSMMLSLPSQADDAASNTEFRRHDITGVQVWHWQQLGIVVASASEESDDKAAVN